jgi:hypothetical protein
MSLYLPLAIGAATFFSLFCFWLAWTRLSDWAPVTARRRGSDYGEAEQDQDRAWPRIAQNWDWTDVDGARRTEIEVMFEDKSGTRRYATITRYIHRGNVIDGWFPVWYLKADPNRTSGNGPFSFTLMGLIGVAATVMMFHLMTAAPH